MARCRALVLLMLLAVSSIAALGLAAPLLRPDRLTVTTGLTASLAWALVGCGGWVALTAALLAIDALTPAIIADHGIGIAGRIGDAPLLDGHFAHLRGQDP